MSERKCAACGAAELEPGVIAETTQGGLTTSLWLRGRPEFGVLGGLKWRDKQRHRIDGYCCLVCGYLNLYLGEAR